MPQPANLGERILGYGVRIVKVVEALPKSIFDF